MQAFVTGSRAYGTPTASSDVDLVAFVSPADMELLYAESHANDRHDNSGGGEDVSIRFGRLNLILVTRADDYHSWREGTEALKARAPVTRDHAIGVLEGLARAARKAPKECSPVSYPVSLYALCALANSREVWPADLRGFDERLRADPKGRDAWMPLADWLEETGEPEMAAAARLVFRRGEVSLHHHYDGKDRRHEYYFHPLPLALQPHYKLNGYDRATPVGALVGLARALEAARKDLE